MPRKIIKKKKVKKNSSSENFVAGRVNTTVRIRPLINNAKESVSALVDVTDKNIVVKDRNDKLLTYSADNILNESQGQEEVYNIVAKPILTHILNGYNGTILAYGQSGSGKSYSMLGDLDSKGVIIKNEQTEGIIPRMMKNIYSYASEHPEEEVSVKMSLVQIYLEKIQDLLGEDPNKTLEIREDPKIGVFIEGNSFHKVHNYKCFSDKMDYGFSRRATSSTNMNLVSSRSHAIMIVDISKKVMKGVGSVTLHPRFYCVDLAGSENAKRANTKGNRLNEGHYINLSLNALGNVISALSKKHNFIPYRNSRLTRLLQNSLGGNCKTSLICNISQEKTRSAETMNTLCFAERAIKIKMVATVNKNVDYKEMCKKLQGKIKKQQLLIDELSLQVTEKGGVLPQVVDNETEELYDMIESFVKDDITEDLMRQIEELRTIIGVQVNTSLPNSWDEEMEDLFKELGQDEHTTADDDLMNEFLAENSDIYTIEDIHDIDTEELLKEQEPIKADDMQKPSEEIVKIIKDDTGKQKALVVEDNMFSRKMMEAMIKSFGYCVDVAGDGMVASKLVEKIKYDVIITDICMPELDGYGLVDNIKVENGLNENTPIIACSALETRDECLGQGIDGFVEKPITMENLKEEINRVINKYTTKS